jgi:hypothetical protein
MTASISETADSVEIGSPIPLFQTRMYMLGSENPIRGQYDVSPDGHFLLNTVIGDGAAAPIIVVQNWDPDRRQ